MRVSSPVRASDIRAAGHDDASAADDGTIILRSRIQLDARRAVDHGRPAQSAAASTPDRPLAAQRDAGDRWETLTYGEARAKADALAQGVPRPRARA